MDYKEILYQNRRIAFYMGAIDSIYFDGKKGLIIPILGAVLKGAAGCRYHESWRWLVPVCVKLGMECIPTDIEECYKAVIAALDKINYQIETK
jgi:hypothetical protein